MYLFHRAVWKNKSDIVYKSIKHCMLKYVSHDQEIVAMAVMVLIIIIT